MDWLNVDEALFYGLVWTMGFLSSLFVTLTSPNYQLIGKCFFVGAVSGFLAFSVVSIFVGRVSEPISGHWYYLGIASLIGLSSKYQEQMIEAFFNKFVSFKHIDIRSEGNQDGNGPSDG
jgi:hypothetical protein